MFPFPGLDHIYLPVPWRQCPGLGAPGAEEQQLGDVPEVKPHAATITAPVFPDLVPDDIGLVGEPPLRP